MTIRFPLEEGVLNGLRKNDVELLKWINVHFLKTITPLPYHCFWVSLQGAAQDLLCTP
jgi:hypothetical protein